MTIYRFNDAPEAPLPQPTPQAPQEPQPVIVPRRKHRVGTAALLALALTGGAIGGGAVGTVAASRWLTPAQSSGTILNPQPINQQAQVPPSNIAGTVYNAVSPSVVEVIISTAQARSGLVETGNGTGFVVDASGLIITNNHVIEDAASITIRFSNDEQRDAQVVGTDVTNDLALLQVENMPSNIPAIPLGDSDSVQVGETAIAIGTPFGLDQTVTQGIISAVDRDWAPQGRPMRGLIQTDTPINPGNSGGPLLNANGEVIGVTTLIESPVRGNVGVGFAVPINTVKQQLPQLQAGENFEQGYLGITAAQAQTNANQQGVTIEDIQPNSGAAQAGLQSGDVITAFEGTPITDFEDLVGEITGRQPAETVTLTITRNGQQQELEVTLQGQAQQPTE